MTPAAETQAESQAADASTAVADADAQTADTQPADEALEPNPSSATVHAPTPVIGPAQDPDERGHHVIRLEDLASITARSEP